MVNVYAIYRRQALHRRQGVSRLAVALLLALAGCDARVPNGALDLYHGLEGGPIADQRPPPPGNELPYPIIGGIPARPLAADVAAQQRISDSLAAQRDSAEAAAAQNPLTALAPAPALPKPPAATDPNASKVVVDAAQAPPAPVPAPAKPAPAPTLGIDSVPAIPAAIASGPLPEFAAAPPPAPVGFETPSPLPPPDKPIAAAPPASLPNGVAVDFTPGSSNLPPSATLHLRRFVLAHPGAALVVTGRGDAVLPNPAAQSRALDLALKRAQAIAASLNRAGVADGHMHLHAEARGTSSTATLLN